MLVPEYGPDRGNDTRKRPGEFRQGRHLDVRGRQRLTLPAQERFARFFGFAAGMLSTVAMSRPKISARSSPPSTFAENGACGIEVPAAAKGHSRPSLQCFHRAGLTRVRILDCLCFVETSHTITKSTSLLRSDCAELRSGHRGRMRDERPQPGREPFDFRDPVCQQGSGRDQQAGTRSASGVALEHQQQ